MNLDPHIPLPPKAAGQPPASKPRRLGRFTRVGLMVIALLLLVQIWDDLRSAAGRRQLLAKAAALFSSADTYIFGGVLLINCLLYSLLVRHFYPTGAHTRSGLGRAIMLLKADDLDPQSEGNELKHCLLIFGLPVLLFGAGAVEYQLLRDWLHSR